MNLFFLKILIFFLLYVYMFYLYPCIFTMCVPGAQNPEDGVGYPGILCGYWKPNPDHLQG